MCKRSNTNPERKSQKPLDIWPPISEIFEPQIKLGDARDLSFLKANIVKLAILHPPYANAIAYSRENPADLSRLAVPEFLKKMAKVAVETYRVLKSGALCAVLIGDLRINKRYHPLALQLMRVFVRAGFILKDFVVKQQNNCTATSKWIYRAKKT